MLPAWVPLAAAGISAGGSLLGGMFSGSAQASANAANLQQAQMASAQQNSQFEQNLRHAVWQSDKQDQRIYEGRQFEAAQVEKQMQWQEAMSNTAYQRAMRDMRSAGLNPMLAYQQGGSSTPVGGAAGPGGSGSPTSSSGGGATAGHVDPGDMGRMIGNIANSAVDAYKSTEQAQQTAASTETINAMREPQRNLVVKQEAAQSANIDKTTHETDVLRQEYKNREETNTLIKAQTNAANAASAASYAAAGEAGERTRQYQKHGMPGYGLGERVLRGLGEAGGPQKLPDPAWPF